MNIDEVFPSESPRAKNYIKAVTSNKLVRKAELRQVFNRTQLKANAIVIDLPSLGDNFRHAVSDKPVRVISCDYTAQTTYKSHQLVHGVYDWRLPKADHLVSVASTHHINDVTTFLKAAQLNLKSTGTIHIADVEPNSLISRFLDAVVHKPEEAGVYRDFKATPGVTRSEVLKCPWVFRTEIEALAYIKSLFNLSHMTLAHVFEHLNDWGLIRVADTFVAINWELLYVDIQLQPDLNFN